MKPGSLWCRNEMSRQQTLHQPSPLLALTRRDVCANVGMAASLHNASKQVFTVLPLEPLSSFVLYFILLRQRSEPNSFNAPQVLWSYRAVEFRSVISGAH